MNLYIKVENGHPVNHPILEDNLMLVLETSELTDEVLAKNGYARFKNFEQPVGTEIIEQDGYEFKPEGHVGPKVKVRELSQEEKVNLWIRRHRDHELYLSDWTQMPDAPLTPEKKAEWAAYRQELRDMTSLYPDLQDPSQIVPPTKPSK
jgi:hypothetical protein